MNPVEVFEGDSPLILGLPHTGTHVPDGIHARLNDRGRLLTDTDWHIHTLYDGLVAGATSVRATFHRYVIDANRDPTGDSLYPGQNTTGLCPNTDFDGEAIWKDGEAPQATEISERAETFHRIYHAALQEQINRVNARHGVAILYDCHSIRSHIPFLFEGRLPDFNVGTNNGTTCSPAIESAVTETCFATEGYTAVLNGRFKGGWTTRHYGQPGQNVHAIQMELAQSTHLVSEALPFDYSAERAARLRPHLATLLNRVERLALDGVL